MTDSLAQQVRIWIARYLAGESTLPQFEESFTSATWNVDADEQAQALVGEVQLRLAEFTNGDWTEDELRDHLAPFAPVWTTPAAIATGATDELTRPILQFSVAGTRSEVVGG